MIDILSHSSSVAPRNRTFGKLIDLVKDQLISGKGDFSELVWDVLGCFLLVQLAEATGMNWRRPLLGSSWTQVVPVVRSEVS